MRKASMAATSSTGILTAALLVTLGSSSAQAKTCWPFGTIIATAGVAVKQDTAKKFARINWRVKVRATATAGTAYTNWDLANNRQYHCVKKLGTWRCSAEATPCRP
jgi:hypothetical protein